MNDSKEYEYLKYIFFFLLFWCLYIWRRNTEEKDGAGVCSEKMSKHYTIFKNLQKKSEIWKKWNINRKHKYLYIKIKWQQCYYVFWQTWYDFLIADFFFCVTIFCKFVMRLNEQSNNDKIASKAVNFGVWLEIYMSLCMAFTCDTWD